MYKRTSIYALLRDTFTQFIFRKETKLTVARMSSMLVSALFKMSELNYCEMENSWSLMWKVNPPAIATSKRQLR